MNNRKKNIAFLYKNFHHGGIESLISNLSHLLGSEYNNHLFLLQKTDRENTFNGKIITGIPVKNRKNIFLKLIKYARTVIRTRRYKKRYKIDTSISFLEYSDLINILSKKNDRIILSVHSSVVNNVRDRLNRIYEFLIKKMYNRADLIIAVSHGVKDILIQKYCLLPEKIKVIHNPFDVGKIRSLSNEPLEREYESFFIDPVIITVGRITELKGQWRAIKALSKLKNAFPDLKVAVMGNGIFEDKLEKYAEELGLSDRVLFISFQKNPFKFISKAAVSILTSDFEGFSNIIVESLACGTPVITTDCPVGPREILAPDSDLTTPATDIEYAKYGIITPFCDSRFDNSDFTREDDLLAEAITTMLNDKELRQNYIRSGYERAGSFDSVKILNQYKEIL